MGIQFPGTIQFMDGSSSQTPAPGIIGLCILLGLAGLVFTGLGSWMLLSGHLIYGLIALGVCSLAWASSWGLYKRRKWGVVLFGLLGLLGSVNHLASTLHRNADLSQADLSRVLGALFSIFLAILIPIGLIYLILLLWRRL